MTKRPRSTGGILGAGIVSVLALAALAFVLIVNHRDASARRAEFREAVILLARANCKELDIIRHVSLARAKDPAQRSAVLTFYHRLEQPISDALKQLDAEPCQP